jgi:N-acetylmuramoyl-L-alanine amidase
MPATLVRVLARLLPRGHRRWSSRAVNALLLTAGLIAWAPAVTAAGSPIASAHVKGTPFHPTTGQVPRSSTLIADLMRPAQLTVRVLDAAGNRVRTLERGVTHQPGRLRFTWNGRTASGAEVVNGGYRFSLDALEAGTSFHSELSTTKASFAIYPANPGAIVVAIDAGHGSPDSGAYYGHKRESDFNLDISQRIQAMLAGARVGVVLVRPVDRWLNVPEIDRNGDGRVDRTDDLQARLDLVNPLRADLMTIVMNNAYGCHCAHGTETFTHPSRTWTPEALELGRLMQEEHIRLLQRYRGIGGFVPTDRGARTSDRYDETRPYAPGQTPRPSSMVTVLVESMFMDQAPELTLLSRPDVRQTIAEAYYNAIARYLNARDYGLRYDVVSAPTDVAPRAPMSIEVKLTNRGRLTARGWKLRLGAVRPPAPVGGEQQPDVPYDGSGALGKQLTRVAVPTLAPGASATVRFHVPAPAGGGPWILKADVALPNDTFISARGVSMLQMPLTVSGSGAAAWVPVRLPAGAAAPAPASTGFGIANEPLFCPVADW